MRCRLLVPGENACRPRRRLGDDAVRGKAAITAGLAARLVAAQFPQWAGLPVRRVEPGGWDNVTFSLGADLSVRLPSGPSYAQQVDKEHHWLPVLAGQLPLRMRALWKAMIALVDALQDARATKHVIAEVLSGNRRT